MDFVWRSLRRLGVPDPFIEDATQEVFMVVYRRLGEFEHRSSLRTWTFGIALRVARDCRKRLSRRPTVPLPPTLPDIQSLGPHEETLRMQALSLLNRVLAEMDERKRAVLILADLEGWSAPEIATALNVGVNTVYSRLRHARRELSATLEKLQDEPKERSAE